MYSLLITSSFGIAVALALALPGVSKWYWAVVFGILTFFASNAVIGYFINKRVKALIAEMQGILADGQRRMQEKTQTWKFRPPGSIKQAQLDMAKMQHEFVSKALDFMGNFRKFEKWSPLLSRQIATMQMQLHYQDKNFKAVDALLPKCLLLEPITVAMAMARTYQTSGYEKATDKKGRPVPNQVDRYFEKGTARLRYGQGALLYGLYAWIKLKSGDVDGAFETLLAADKKMENECLKRNIENLKNNRIKHFSLAGLGDEWYALGLEEPKLGGQRMPRRPF